MNFKASAVDRQGDDVVVVTTTPDPHNQTTSAHTEAGGEVSF